MPNLSSILKAEISRLARKEVKSAVNALRKTIGTHRREIAELKRQLASSKRDFRAFKKPVRETDGGSGQARTRRFTATGLKALRARLGLSAADLGRLVGVSGQSIYNWEAGKALPRPAQQVALAAIRGLGKREAAKRLESEG